MAVMDEPGAAGGGIIQQTDQQLQKLSELRVRTREYSSDLRSLAGAGKDAGEALTRAFTGAALRGKDLSDTFRSVILSLSQRTLKSAASSFSGAIGKGLGSLLSGAMRNASGNAFSEGRVIPLARGGVVNSPSLFAMQGGNTGLMGEAGPEAILPLARGADGRLGVRAGEGAGRAVTINFNVTTPDAQGFRRSAAQIAAMLQRAAGRGARNL
ncbi:MAG TPA: phage tail tape measure protein [Alphaproteobacteria bacterium]|nr:phage tail tape measure protein [Alphaproteobacteria bacterium]